MPDINLLNDKVPFDPIDSGLSTGATPIIINSNVDVNIVPQYVQHSNNSIITGLISQIFGVTPQFNLYSYQLLSGNSANTTLTITSSVLGSLTIKSSPNPGFQEYIELSLATFGEKTTVVNSIVSTLNQLPVFKQNYIAYNNNTDTLFIKALYSGTKYDIVISKTGTWNTSPVVVQAGTNQFRGELFSKYSVFADLYINATGDFGNNASINRSAAKRVFEYEKIFNKRTNIHTIDFASVLNTFNRSTLPPQTNILGTGDYINIYHDTTALTNYFYIFGESTSSSATGVKKKSNSGSSAIYWCLNSSTDYLNKNYNTDLEQYIISTSTGGSPIVGKFLTLQPKYKEVDVNSSTEWLSFLFKRVANLTGPQLTNTQSTGDIKFGIRVIFYHKTTKTTTTKIFRDTQVNTGTLKNTNVGGCHYFNVSPKQLLIDSFGGVEDVDYYTVSLIYTNRNVTDIEVTPTVTYKVYKHDYQNCNTTPTTLVFETSLGRYESILFSGKQEKSIVREITKGFRPVGFYPIESGLTNYSDKVNYILDNNVSPIFTISTGYINNTQKEYYLDLLNSNNVYLVNGNKLEYILIEENNWNIDNYTGLSSLTIKYRKTVGLNNTKNR